MADNIIVNTERTERKHLSDIIQMMKNEEKQGVRNNE